jgi:hypothetical protein
MLLMECCLIEETRGQLRHSVLSACMYASYDGLCAVRLMDVEVCKTCQSWLGVSKALACSSWARRPAPDCVAMRRELMLIEGCLQYVEKPLFSLEQSR